MDEVGTAVCARLHRLRRDRAWARLVGAGVSLLALSLSLEARACPDCPDGIRARVRAGVFDEAFARNLAVSALPFVVLAGITAVIHGAPGRRGSRG